MCRDFVRNYYKTRIFMIRGEKLASLRNLTRVIQLHCPFPENFSRRSALSSDSKTRKNKMGTLSLQSVSYYWKTK